MKLNRNKKILIGLMCLGVGFVLYKYFGNVVEGFDKSYVNNLLTNIKTKLDVPPNIEDANMFNLASQAYIKVKNIVADVTEAEAETDESKKFKKIQKNIKSFRKANTDITMIINNSKNKDITEIAKDLKTILTNLQEKTDPATQKKLLIPTTAPITI